MAGGQSGAEGQAAAPVSAPAGDREEPREGENCCQPLSTVTGLTQGNTSEKSCDRCDRDLSSVLGHRALNTNHNLQARAERGRPRLHQAQPSHHMDFKANLKGVKAKTEEVRKGNSTQQMDFRAVLGKKGDKPANKSSDALTKTDTDFRSVLTNKKKPASPEKNGENDTTAVNNCIEKDINEKKSSDRGPGMVPQFVEKLNDLTVLDGQRLRLQCRLTTSDLTGMSVIWTLDGKVIKSSKFIILASEGQRSCRKNAGTFNIFSLLKTYNDL